MRNTPACPGLWEEAGRLHHQEAVSWPRRREELEGRGWEGQAVERSPREWILEPNSSSLCLPPPPPHPHFLAGSPWELTYKLLSPMVVMGVLPCQFIKSPGGRIDVAATANPKICYLETPLPYTRRASVPLCTRSVPSSPVHRLLSPRGVCSSSQSPLEKMPNIHANVYASSGPHRCSCSFPPISGHRWSAGF